MRWYAHEFSTSVRDIGAFPLFTFLIEFGEAAQEAEEERKEIEKRQKKARMKKPRYSRGRHRRR